MCGFNQHIFCLSWKVVFCGNRETGPPCNFFLTELIFNCCKAINCCLRKEVKLSACFKSVLGNKHNV